MVIAMNIRLDQNLIENYQTEGLNFLKRITARWQGINKNWQLEICAINKNKKIKSSLFLATLEGLNAAIAQAKSWNEQGFNIYFCPNPVRAETKLYSGKRSSDKDIVAAFYNFVDADSQASAQTVFEDQNFFCFKVTTGSVPFRRLHGYAELKEPIIFIHDQALDQSAKAVADWRAEQQKLINKFHSDPVIKNTSRLMRLPGFLSYAKDETRKDEFVTWSLQNTNLVDKDFFTHPLDHIDQKKSQSIKIRDVLNLDYHARTDAMIDEMLEASKITGNWHINMRNVTASLVGRGWSDFEITRKCAQFCNLGATDPDLLKLISTARDKGWGQKNNITDSFKTGKADTQNNKFPLVRASDLVSKEPEFVVEGILETDSLAQIFGDPQCGKSFIGIDIAACVATGTPFHGRQVKKGSVIFVAGEGHSGLRRRLSAWEKHNNVSINGVSLFISKMPAQFLEEQSALSVQIAIDEIVSREGKPELIIIDTVARNFGPGDENATQDMGRFVAALDHLKVRYACTVLLIHHSGHSDKNRGRGATALKAALDAEFKAEKHGETITLKNTKMKDSAPPENISWRLKSVDIGANSDGEIITSAVLVSNHENNLPKIKPLSQSEEFALNNFVQACFKYGRLDDQGNFAGLPLEMWRKHYYSQSTLDNADSKNTAFARARKSLQNRGEISVLDDVYFPSGSNAEKLRRQFAQALISKNDEVLG